MINIRSPREIALMKEAGHINYLTHEELKKYLKPGITTDELNKIAHDFIIAHDAIPSCLNFEGFPKSICISINDEVVHGIPGSRKLKNGDIISIDFCVRKNGYESDSARTYVIGDVTDDVKQLVEKTEEALYIGLNQVKAGARVGDISHAIQEFAENNGYGVVRELVGHGVGTSFHEEPEVPNYGEANTGKLLKAGMVIAVEPMINLGKKEVLILDDDWTVVTEDGLPSAHFEHTVVVTKDGYEILTGE